MWQVLNEVKTEFLKYADWVEEVKKKIEQTHKALDDAETRTRAVRRRLERVESLSPATENLMQETAPKYVEE